MSPDATSSRAARKPLTTGRSDLAPYPGEQSSGLGDGSPHADSGGEVTDLAVASPAGSAELDAPVRDRLHLESLPVVVDRLLQSRHDLGAAAGLTHIRRVADSVLLDLAGPVSGLAALRTFSALSVVLDPAEPVSGLRRSLNSGLLSVLGVRAPSYRVAPMASRAALIAAIKGELGWANAPSAWDVNVTTAGHRGELLIAQVGPLHRSRRFPALRRIPASANPLVAWLLVKLAKVEPGHSLLDPCCGAGTILVEADVAGCGPLYGSDIAAAALQAARANLPDPAVLLDSTPADRLPHSDGSIDRIVSNLPFGKRVGSHQGNRDLYPALLAEAARALRPDGRAVLMTEDKRIFEQAVQSTHGIKVVKEVTLSTGGLHPSAYVIERTRAHRRAVKHGTRPRWPPCRRIRVPTCNAASDTNRTMRPCTR